MFDDFDLDGALEDTDDIEILLTRFFVLSKKLEELGKAEIYSVQDENSDMIFVSLRNVVNDDELGFRNLD